MNVLITGCGAHSKSIIDSLKNNEDRTPVRVIGINSNESKLLREGVDVSYIVPLITDENYIDVLMQICIKNDIHVILPYITAELGLLARNKKRIEETGVKVSIASPESLLIANDKIELSKLYCRIMPTQTVVHTVEEVVRFAELIGFPSNQFCVKLSNKCGGAGFSIVDNELANEIELFNRAGVNRYISLGQLLDIVEHNDLDIILQEYVKGLDYSVVVLADGEKAIHKLGYVGYDMEFGAVVNGEVIFNAQAYDIVDEIVNDLKLEGNLCFDFILTDDGSAVLLEINPRINASLSFAHAAGINFPFLRCKQLLGSDVSEPISVKYGLKMNKYYEAKYYV